MIDQIERAGFRAAPAAETFRLGGWSCNIGRGVVGRMNSVTTFGFEPFELFETVEQVERRYRYRGRTVRFRLTARDDNLDDLLDARGYERSEEVLVMTGPVAPGEVAATTLRGVTAGWLSLYRQFRPADEDRAAEIGEGLAGLDRDHLVFDLDKRAVGVGVVDAGLLGIFDVAVDPPHRRSGLGTRITQSILAWGASKGADTAYLMVEESNHAGLSLYRGLGFEEAYRYWYRSQA